MVEKVEFTGYMGKAEELSGKDAFSNIFIESASSGGDLDIYPNEAEERDWGKENWPPKKVKVTIEVIDA